MKLKIYLAIISSFIFVFINYQLAFAENYNDKGYFQIEENSNGEFFLKKYLLTKDKISDGGKLEIPDVEIPGEVDYISEYAFQDCMVKNVTMNDNIKGIGEYAFYASRAWSIKISNNVDIIEKRAFGRCDFNEIVLPNKLIEIGPAAFDSCVYLKSVKIPKEVKVIDDGAFCSCIRLKKTTIPESVRYIGNEAFKNTKLKSIYIPEEVEVIGTDAFDKNVTIIGEKNSEAEKYAKRNGNIFMIPKEKEFCDKYINFKTVGLCIVTISIILIIVISVNNRRHGRKEMLNNKYK